MLQEGLRVGSKREAYQHTNMWRVNQTRDRADQAMSADGSTCGIPYLFQNFHSWSHLPGLCASRMHVVAFAHIFSALCPCSSKEQVIPDSALGRIALGRYYGSLPFDTMYQQGFFLPEIPSLLLSQPLKAQTKRGGRPTRAHNLSRCHGPSPTYIIHAFLFHT